MLGVIVEYFQLLWIAYYALGAVIFIAVIRTTDGWKGKMLGGAIVVALFGFFPLKWRIESQQKEADLIAINKAMNAQFTKRCTENAGTSIKRVIENVDGVFLMRPRTAENTRDLESQNPVGDMYGLSPDNSTQLGRLLEGSSHLLDGRPRPRPIAGYKFIEMANPERATKPEAAPFVRITLNSDKENATYYDTIVSPVSVLKSKYGLDWEDTTTPEDRRHWIAGGIARVIDLQSNESIAERIGFVASRMRDGRVGGGIWTIGIGNGYCPAFENEEYKTLEFLSQVLKSSKEFGDGYKPSK